MIRRVQPPHELPKQRNPLQLQRQHSVHIPLVLAVIRTHVQRFHEPQHQIHAVIPRIPVYLRLRPVRDPVHIAQVW